MSETNLRQFAKDIFVKIKANFPMRNEILDMTYPVGSIYMSLKDTSPATLFGGTWEQIMDRFLLSAGNSYSVGSTGGESAHTLSIDEMPSHHHTHGEYITDGDYGFVPAGSSIGSLVHSASQNDSRNGVMTDRSMYQRDTSFIGWTGGGQHTTICRLI